MRADTILSKLQFAVNIYRSDLDRANADLREGISSQDLVVTFSTSQKIILKR